VTVLKSGERAPGRVLPARRLGRMTWIAAAGTSGILLLLPEVIRLDGTRHADWLQFVGRFHPLAVHIPIGLIVLVPLLEIAGRFRPALREAVGFVLGLACAACFVTLILGFLLAYGGGESGITVTRHMWGGIALFIGLQLCMFARSYPSNGAVRNAYPWLLAGALCVLVWTAHQGGTLTRGSNYLTEYMPLSLKRLGSFGTAGANPQSFYGKQIHPIFDANCVTCHGSGKTEGGLRLDSFELLMKGGKDGRVVVPGSAQRSVLVERIMLPAGDKHLMPAEGRPSLRPEEIARVRAWIDQGASPSAATVAGFADEKQSEAPIQPVGDYSTLLAEIQQMEHSQGAKLLPVSAKASDGLILSALDVGASFGDAQLAQFQKFAPFVVEANLARTSVTDASFDALSKFTHLRALHLEGTAVTGRGLAKLASLSQLTYLNLSETKVDPSAAAMLASMKNLRHVYLFDTPAQPVSDEGDQSSKRSAQ